MKLKVCGMRDTKNIEQLLQLNPDFVGFIFYEKSPRNVGEELDQELLKNFPSATKKVGVFVNAPLEFVKSKVAKFGLDYVQLHGDESVDYVAQLYAVGIGVIKVFSVGEEFDFSRLGQYNPFVDFFLFDTKTPARGGSGRRFNWDLLKAYDQRVPFFLSGGISLENLEDVSKLEGMNVYAIDVNSKFEISPGLKDMHKLKALKEKMME